MTQSVARAEKCKLLDENKHWYQRISCSFRWGISHLVGILRELNPAFNVGRIHVWSYERLIAAFRINHGWKTLP